MIRNSEILRQYYKLNDCPVCPLPIGVTGHRHLTSDPAKIQIIRSQICSFVEQCLIDWKSQSESTTAPILFFTGLAEGADQLAAEEIFELRKKASPQNQYGRIKVIGVLPMPKEFFEQDFDTPETLKHFKEIHDQCDSVIYVDLTKENSDKNNAGQPIDRDAQYKELGDFLAANCFVLLALWDGNTSACAAGSTTQVVLNNLQGLRPQVTGSGPSDDQQYAPRVLNTGMVYQIVCRQEKPDYSFIPNNEGYTLLLQSEKPHLGFWNWWKYAFINLVRRQSSEQYFTIPANAKYFFEKSQVWTNLDFMKTFNHDSLTNCSKVSFQKKMSESKQYLFEGDQEVYAKAMKSDDCVFLSEYYAYADVMSQMNQKNHFNYVFLSIPFLASVSMFPILYMLRADFEWLNKFADTFNINASIFGTIGSSIVFPILCLLWAYNYFWGVSIGYRRYRTLAEGLRIQIFWGFAGINCSVIDSFRENEIPYFDWLRMTLKSLIVPVDGNFEQDIPMVKKIWIKGQRDWMMNKVNQFKTKMLKLSFLQWTFWGLAGLALVNRGLIYFDCNYDFQWGFTSYKSLLVASFTLLFFCGCMCQMLSKTLNYSDLIEQYEESLDSFNTKLYQLRNATNSEVIEIRITDLGNKALTENARWYRKYNKFNTIHHNN